jgi:hypothetical protein
MRVGVEMAFPGVIMGASEELALAATAIDRHPNTAIGLTDEADDVEGRIVRERGRVER